MNEPERNRIIELTARNSLIGPGSIPWEIGNAFSAMFKQNRLTFEEARKGLSIFETIPVQYIKTDFFNVVSISRQTNTYAYDAYFLDCAIWHNAPILTLDRKLITVAKSLKLSTLEV